MTVRADQGTIGRLSSYLLVLNDGPRTMKNPETAGFSTALDLESEIKQVNDRGRQKTTSDVE